MTDTMSTQEINAISESKETSMELVQVNHCNLPAKLPKVSLPMDSSYCFPTALLTDLIVDVMRSADETEQFHAAQACRQLLDCYTEDPPTDMLIAKGIVSRCIDFLSAHHNPALQFESLWALTNVTAGTSEQTMYVINHKAIPKLVELLKSPVPEVAEQAAWVLGNIAGDSPEARDRVLDYNCMPLLLRLIKPDTSVAFTRNIIRTIANVCRHDRSPPPFAVVRMALPALTKLLDREDPDVSADASMALSYLNEGFEGWMEGVQNTLEEFQLFFSIVFYAAILYVWVISCFEKINPSGAAGNYSSPDVGIPGFAALQEIRGQESQL
ncbi:importin subunit alpha-8 [Diachasma alloeum]|uniref:importin subunit alpha-8 n=1 Tax=Diachasma alloeum TaxID=454923 RepID=UPI0007381D37|nr:importin subunit alpha-8 [Diachasma alloeum]